MQPPPAGPPPSAGPPSTLTPTMERLENRILAEFATGAADRDIALVDVGSMQGIGAEWTGIREHLRVLGFEPDEREFSRLATTERERHLPFALADRPRELVLHVSQDPGKTSIYEPNWELLDAFPYLERWATIERVTLPASRVSTLDACVEAERLRPDFLKLDTQGSELLILEGADRSLRDSVLGVQTEVEFLELYRGQPLFADVDAFLRARGFELLDLRRVYWKREGYRHFPGRGQLVFGDALYLRGTAAMQDLLAGEADPFATLLRFSVVAAVYGVHDIAATLLQQCLRTGLGDRAGVQALLETIRSHDEFYHWDWVSEDSVLGGRGSG